MPLFDVALACKHRVEPVFCLEVWQLTREEEYIFILLQRLANDLIDKRAFASSVDAGDDVERPLE